MQAAIQRNKLFLASCIALILTSMIFVFRTSPEGVSGGEFNLINEEIRWMFSPTFLGFALATISGAIIYLISKDATLLFAGSLCIGMKIESLRPHLADRPVLYFNGNESIAREYLIIFQVGAGKAGSKRICTISILHFVISTND